MTVYETITARIVAALEAGTAPWRRPWSQSQSVATNYDGRPYSGVNRVILGLASATPVYLTFKRALAMGGNVRKGEKALPCVYWQMLAGKDKDTGKPTKIPLLRLYHVFSIDQCENIPMPAWLETDRAERPQNERIAAAESIVASMPNPPAIRASESGGAWYCPSRDEIQTPTIDRHESASEYYSTLFHELGHSTGHATRLSRKGITGERVHFGSADYGREELVAELTASFLCQSVGIDTCQDNSNAYLAGWIKALKADPKAIIVAAGQASKAADHVLGKTATSDPAC